MPSGIGKIVLMGSGELTATMVEVHKGLLSRLKGSARASFLDTPAGFQLNADQISQKAAEYFRNHVQHSLMISSLKNRETISDFDAEQAHHTLRESNYILIGPGSPTYALRQWQDSPVPEIFTQCVTKGGCLVAASAAALTIGRFTLPVYEVYKVGQDLHWAAGMDILGKFGFNLVVIPHWNNAEGGNHDTRFCFMGAPRFRKLEALLPEDVSVFGLDEHTACILNLETDEAEVKGIGRVTLRRKNGVVSFKTGDRFPLEILRGESVAPGWKPESVETPAAADSPDSGGDSFWNKIHRLEAGFQDGLEKHDPKLATNALLELDRTIWQGQTDMENEEFVVQARDTFRDLIVLLGNELAAAPRNRAECLAPVVEALLELRQNFRAKKQWLEADAIRDLLQQINITVEDDKDGSRWLIET
jgi:hypothetical protein